MSKLERLRNVGFNELRVRGAQATAAFAERRGWSALSRMPTDQFFQKLLNKNGSSQGLANSEALLSGFRDRKGPKSFAGLADRAGTVASLRSRWPEAETQIIAKANRILSGRFDLLGLHDLTFGDPIDWQREPISGKRAPADHWSRLNYLDAAVTGDKKIVWELNRHQYFATLGQAYWLTGDERYADGFVEHLTSWMDQNPPKLGINWASSLEVSFRAISWLWALYFFRDSPALTSAVFLRALKFLYLHARHVETYLSTYFSPNTHLTGEALGLFYLGTLLPEFRAAARWRKIGKRILVDQLSRQVKPDGVYFEQSSYYQRYTADFYTHFLVLANANDDSLSDEVAEKLKLLLDHLMYITRPDGTTPFFGDDDGGRLVTLDQRPANDFRSTLSTGAALFQRGDYKYVAGEVALETMWLLGTPGLAEFDRVAQHVPEKQSVSFPNGGYYVMRDGWSAAANYMLLDCGPHGMDNCGHAHADALSFELAACGRTMLVDPGTYTYTGSKELRDWFRSSPAHNALTVDGESSSVSAGPFSWSTEAQSEMQSWVSRARFDYFEGKHDGYQRLSSPVAYSRRVLFLKDDYFVMCDRVQAEGSHRYELSFHFDVGAAPNLEFVDDFAASVRDVNSIGGLAISCFASQAAWRREQAPVSHCYGDQAPAPLYVFSATANGGADLVTFLLPESKSKPAPALREVAAVGGQVFEVLSETSYDIVMIRNGSRVEMARLASDFDWTWARFASETATVPEELVLIGGQQLQLDGKDVLRSGRRINCLVASRVGDQFVIETDDGVFQRSLFDISE